MMSFAGKTALVTGALTGIGRATALVLGRGGTSVVVSGRSKEAGRILVQAVCDLGAEAQCFRADLRREDEVSALVDQAVARFGRLGIAMSTAPGLRADPRPLSTRPRWRDDKSAACAAVFGTNGEAGRVLCGGPAQAGRQARGDRPRNPVRSLRRCGLRHRPDHPREWRQNRVLNHPPAGSPRS